MSLVKRQDAIHGPHRQLAVGDPWTFIYPEPVINEDTGRPVQPGDMLAKWFDTAEPGRLFRIERVHAPASYETIFVGFQEIIPG